MKVLCTRHPDTNPSVEVYADGGYCWVCQEQIPLKELEIEPQHTIRERENIQDTLRYIQTLGKRIARGVELPYDSRGYYIVWPSGQYYKCRLNAGKSRYIGPAGHRPPLFIIEGTKNTLHVVEGELNALSLQQVMGSDQCTLASPGAASEFSRHIGYYSQFSRIYLWVDKDPAGIANGWVTKETLTKLGKNVTLNVMDVDFNQLLQDGGPELVLKRFKEGL